MQTSLKVVNGAKRNEKDYSSGGGRGEIRTLGTVTHTHP